MDIDASRLRHLANMLDQVVGDSSVVDSVLQKANLSRKDVATTTKTVDPLKEAYFVREACDVLGDPTFGVQAGLSFKESTSLTGYISRYSKDLRAAIENSSKYYSIIDPTHTFSLRVSGNSASLELDYIDATYAKFHRHNEFLLFGALSRLRTVTGTNFYPIEIRFDHEVKASAKKIEKLAGFPLVFGTEKMEIILSLSSLDLPVPTYDLSLRQHLTELGERRLQEQPNSKLGLRAKIEGILASGLPGRLVPADEVASDLGMSRRTFARRLKDDGLSFRGIVDDLRCDLAKTYLKGGFSISEISFYLDYTDQAAFSTAFKRWTGSSPSEFKNSGS